MAEKKTYKRTVVVPVDGSVNAGVAFEFYLKGVHQPEDRLIILHVFELPPLPYSSGPFVFAYYEEWSRVVKETREVQEAMLRSYEEQCKIENVHFETLMVVGKPAGEVICRVCQDEHADLVIMGTRGQGLIRRTFVGSVSDYVVHHAHVPVGVVPLPPKVEQQA